MLRSSFRLAAILMFAGGIGVATAGPQNLLTDPGFEHPPAPQGTFKVYEPGQEIGAWTVVGASGNVALTSTTEMDGEFVFEAHSGQGYVDLTGNCDCGAPSGVAQTVATIPGQTYQLTFWGSNPYFPGHGTTSQIQVYVGTTLIFTSLNKHGKGLEYQVWKKFSTSFVATDTASTISFINGDPNGDFMNGLDDVRLVEAPN
jgi:hypothetical protein